MQKKIEVQLPPLTDVERRPSPFPHFVASQWFAREVADAAYKWLDGTVFWNRHVTSFFDQFECSMTDPRLPPLLHDNLVSPTALRSMRRLMQEIFFVSLDDIFTVTGHRLVPGQGIGMHTDQPRPGRETYRMVVHLGPATGDSAGGHLMFFAGDAPEELGCAFRAVENSAVGFELSERSFHAVGEVSTGVRYTLVYSFYRADGLKQIERPGLRLADIERRLGRQKTYLAPHAASGRVLDDLLQVLISAGAARGPEPKTAILPDLVDTYELLRRWRCADEICLAGLYHGVYGTALSEHQLISLDQRDEVRGVIGEPAERLLHISCAADYDSLKQALRRGDPGLVEDRWRHVPLGIDEDTMVALVTLIMAYWRARHERFKRSKDEWDQETELFDVAEPYLDGEMLRDLRYVYVNDG